jgi:hypothetical protein
VRRVNLESTNTTCCIQWEISRIQACINAYKCTCFKSERTTFKTNYCLKAILCHVFRLFNENTTF